MKTRSRGPWARLRPRAALVLLVSTLLFLAPDARAAITITVNTTADAVSADGGCALREAIQAANGNVSVNECVHDGSSGTDTIAFAIGAAGSTQTIVLGSALPAITSPLILDGTSQSGVSGCDQITLPLIVLDGTAVAGAGLTITGSDSAVRGFVVHRFGGVGIDVSQGSGIAVQCNFVGTDATGTSAAANGSSGIAVHSGATDTLIGGDLPTTSNLVSGNLVSGNTGSGIEISDAATTGTRVLGNLVGTDVTGTSGLGNDDGIQVDGATDTTIGGTANGARNLISGNLDDGIDVRNAATGTTVLGNYVGVDVTGTAPLGNADDGIQVQGGATGSVIGGTAAGAGNVIAANVSDGVALTSATTTLNRVEGNLIGTDATGTNDLGNLVSGVRINLSATGNTVGGAATAAGNLIAFNDAGGVFVDSGAGNSILSNTIRANDGLAVDLAPSGVTANDLGDGDIGANRLQNFPSITTFAVGGASTNVQGTLDSTASRSFTIQVYGNSACDPSGFGEAEQLLGSTTATTDAGGAAAFSLTFPNQALTIVTATATDQVTGDTSELSECVTGLDSFQITGDASDPSVTGETITVSWSASGSAGVPTGTVLVSDSASAATCSAAVGVGSCDLALPAAGSRTLTASYSGDSTYAGSEDTEPHTVDPAATTTTITGFVPESAETGQSLRVLFTVDVVAPGSGSPTGQVSVSGGGAMCTAPVATGFCDLVPTTSGDVAFVATYEGDPSYLTSASPEAILEIVEPIEIPTLGSFALILLGSLLCWVAIRRLSPA